MHCQKQHGMMKEVTVQEVEGGGGGDEPIT